MNSPRPFNNRKSPSSPWQSYLIPFSVSRRRISSFPLFILLLFLSILFSSISSPPALYSPLTSFKYSPPPQPANTPFIQNSIIVPTYKERDNLVPLVKSIFAALGSDLARRTEVVVVDDDSDDGTEEEVDKLHSEGWQVRVIVRNDERGLSSAVLRGFESARGENLIVMDADLQHPPSALPDLIASLTPKKPFAIATRYGPTSGSTKNWSLTRRIISWGARCLALPLTSASDPMTGFFAVRKESFLLSLPITSSGFKIALELLLKTPNASPPSEIPYSFGLRTTGTSKLGAKVIIKYVGQLIELYKWKLGIVYHVIIAGGIVAGLKAIGLGKRALMGRGRREEWALPSFASPGIGGGSGDRVKRRAWE